MFQVGGDPRGSPGFLYNSDRLDYDSHKPMGEKKHQGGPRGRKPIGPKRSSAHGSEADTSGILNLRKLAGLTSHDVVDRVRKILKLRRVGHGGTLDPMAEGVLLVGFGAGTKILQYLSDLSKSYQATLRLGEETDTMDSEGRTVLRRPVPHLEKDEIGRVLLSFTGPRKQRPPAYSAVKVGGVPAYRLARKGKKVILPPRPIKVEALSLLDWDPPDLEFSARVSKGTYIRRLACDLAVELGSCGHLVSLTRTAIGRHTISDSLSLEDLEECVGGSLKSVVISLPEALDHLILFSIKHYAR